MQRLDVDFAMTESRNLATPHVHPGTVPMGHIGSSARSSVKEPQNRSSVSPNDGLLPHNSAAHLLQSQMTPFRITGVDGERSSITYGLILGLSFAECA